MKIGILQPLSNVYPGMAKDFMDGFNSFIERQQLTGAVTVKKENIGFGGTEKEVYAKAEILLVSEDVDILVAYIDEKVTGMLYSLVQATGKLLIIVNPGANYPLNWVAQPTVVHLGLQHAFLCWLTGGLAGKEKKGAAYASSFYDCGYLHSAAMVRNILGSGGQILYNYINNQAYDENFDINQLTDFLTANTACDNLVCVYDELPASLFFDRLQKFKRNDPLHLFVSPMMMTEKALGKKEEAYHFSIEGFLPWLPGMDKEENRHFMKACTRPPSVFSLLGWETALILKAIIEQGGNNLQEGEELVSFLKKTTLAGPRGEMKLDHETLYYTAPAGRFTLEAGSVEPRVEWNSRPESEWKDFTSLQTEGVVSGWTNTYLCY
jgi:branched-chain amino acid transport system substrate-binding protein